MNGVLNLGRSGMAMVVVTHEMNFARRLADHGVFMDEGRVSEVAPPERIFGKPESPCLRCFLSEVLWSAANP